MPVQAYQLSIFFEQEAAGWTWTFFDRAATIQAALDDAKLIAQATPPLLGDGVKISHIRASEVKVDGDSWVSELPTLTGPSSNSFPDQPFVAALMRLESGALFRRQLYIRGIPVGVSKLPPGGEQGNRNKWLGALATWKKKLLSLSGTDLGPALQVHGRGANNERKEIISITAGADTYDVKFTTALPVTSSPYAPEGTIAEGDLLQIYNIREFPSLAGRFRVLAVNAVTRVVTIAFPGATAFTYAQKAKGRKVAFGYLQIVNAIHEGYVSKRVGRPFSTPRGRRKRRIQTGI